LITASTLTKKWTTTVEYLRAIRTIGANDIAESRGEYVQFGPIWSWPKPYRPEGPPILLGGNGPRAVQRALDHGDEWFPEDRQPVEELAARIAEIRRLADETGRPRIPVSLFSVEPDRERLRRIEEADVHRVAIYAPSADRETVLPFLDMVADIKAEFG
jgi:alkanesulfonate monooxygenase SsuD/methylene tetrahydromethanopterin reductase-like flavin-dependent oxidoreductase (luciferase family)